MIRFVQIVQAVQHSCDRAPNDPELCSSDVSPNWTS